jgi:hypothetical protein
MALLRLRNVYTVVGLIISMLVAAVLIGGIAHARPADAAEPAQRYRISLSMDGCGTLTSGSRGACVRTLQTWLNLVDNADLTVDGRFGPATGRAVREFQARFGVPATGNFGPLSRAALQRWYANLDDEYAPDKPSRAPVAVPLPCQQASTNDTCNDRIDDDVLHTSFGDSLLKSLACNGLGAVVGRFNFLAGFVTAVVCDVLLS